MTDFKKPFLLRLPQEVKEELEDAAQKRGVSLNALIAQVLWLFLQEQERSERDDEGADGRCGENP